MKKGKKIVLAALLLLVSAAGGMLGTVAYLQTVTPTSVNAFASDKKISIALRESAWDGYDFDDPVTQNGQGIKPGLSDTESAALGYVQARVYVPGQQIPKNPVVKNTGSPADGVAVYAAVKVQYFDAQEQLIPYETFLASYLSENGILFDAGWTKISGEEAEQIYLYNAALMPGAQSTPLFTGVPVSARLTAGADGRLPSFSVHVTAYAIQADNMGESFADVCQAMYQFAATKKN